VNANRARSDQQADKQSGGRHFYGRKRAVTRAATAIALLAALAATAVAAQPKPVPPAASTEEGWFNLPPSVMRAIEAGERQESWHAKDPAKAKVDPRGALSGAHRQLAPPAKYDRPYTGDLVYARLSTEADVSSICPKSNLPYKLGCAFMSGGKTKDGAYNRCQVFIVADTVIARAGFKLDDIYRHEIAHCNGWPPGHDGARLLP
jgi:hypothetical protein